MRRLWSRPSDDSCCEAGRDCRRLRERVMNLLWLIPLLLEVCAETLTEVEVNVGQSVVLNCSSTGAGDIVWYLKVNSQVTARILRTFSPKPDDNQHYVFPRSKYQAVNNSLKISNLTEEDLRLYFCGVPGSENFSSSFCVRSVPVAPPTNSPAGHQQGEIRQSEEVVFTVVSLVISLAVNILLLLVVIALCVYWKRRSCRSQVSEPSPLTPDNQDVMETRQYEEIQFPTFRAPPPSAPPPPCIYYKVQLP